MGSKQTIAAVIAVLLIAGGMGFLLHRQQKLENAWQAERALLHDQTALQKLQQSQAEMAQKTAADQTALLQEQLTAATNELATARLKVEAYEAKRQIEAQAQVAEVKRSTDLNVLKSEVPEPLVTVTALSGKKEQKTYTFPKLMGPDRKTLATNAEFRTQFGRRFVFKSGEGRTVAYDVDELHGGVLVHLGLNRDMALSAQSDIDRQAQVAEQKYRASLVARAEAEKKNAEIRARMMVEYAKLSEERRKARLEEDLKIQAAETERIKAEASMRSADAAVQEALRPFYPEYFIKQVLTPPPVIIVPQPPSQQPLPNPPTNPFVRDPRIN